MRRLWGAVASLPTTARWTILGVGGLLAVLLIGSGVWALLQQRETAARRAFARVTATYRPAILSGQEASLTGAAQTLKQFLEDFPRSSPAAQAWYLLGNVEYQRRGFDAALAAYGQASRRSSGSVAGLSLLGQGYVWEAKAEPSRALEVYQAALTGRDPKDFLYGELLLATGRVQEELKQPAAAIASYTRFLKDIPSSSRAEEVRIRLAILGASA